MTTKNLIMLIDRTCTAVVWRLRHFSSSSKRRINFEKTSNLRACDVEVFETLLKENFENHQRVFGSLQPNSGAKIAITATTISDALPFVFSNYNGVGTRHSEIGKLVSK